MKWLVVPVVVGTLLAIGLVVSNGGKQDAGDEHTTTSASSASRRTNPVSAAMVTWKQTTTGYQASSMPPKCATQLVRDFPADITKVTSVLYPGQYRDGVYQPNGGLRFDSATNEVSVRAPFDGTVLDGAAYYADATGTDIEYDFDIMNDCGLMFHVGRLLELSPALQTVARNLPAPVAGSTHMTMVTNGIAVKAGALLATAIGTTTTHQVYFDFGISDWTKPNDVASNATWLQDAKHNTPLAKHAVCWITLLSSSDEVKVVNLPADPVSGKTSDYCK